MNHYFDKINGINDQFTDIFTKYFDDLTKQNKKKIGK